MLSEQIWTWLIPKQNVQGVAYKRKANSINGADKSTWILKNSGIIICMNHTRANQFCESYPIADYPTGI